MPEEDFKHLIIKRYKYWTVYLHGNQGYLGRMYVWLNREGDIDYFLGTMVAERVEFDQIARELWGALTTLFSPDRANWGALSNEAPHCHVHLVPRYLSDRAFAGLTFIDKDPKKNWLTDKSLEFSLETLETIRAAIAEELERAT